MHKKNAEIIPKIIKLKKEGLSNAVIAERLGVKLPFITYAMRAYGNQDVRMPQP